jgi:hypothetical protein
MKVNLNRAVHKLWENSPDKGAHSKSDKSARIFTERGVGNEYCLIIRQNPFPLEYFSTPDSLNSKQDII